MTSSPKRKPLKQLAAPYAAKVVYALVILAVLVLAKSLGVDCIECLLNLILK